MMSPPDDTPQGRVTALQQALQARAAGFWHLAGDGDRLEQLAFAPSPEVPDEAARAFAEATRSVALTRDDLGIVRAVRSGETVVSRMAELPADSGSGHWLRELGASRSVAVPIRDSRGKIWAVCAVAFAESPLSEEIVAERVRAAALGLASAR